VERKPERTFLIFFLFVTFVFREKYGLVRNDFLDFMMELRKWGWTMRKMCKMQRMQRKDPVSVRYNLTL